MKRHVAVMVCALGLIGASCAGSLEDPSRFEQGVQTARGNDDAGVGDDGEPEDDQEEPSDEGEPSDDDNTDGASTDDEEEPAPVSCDFEALMEAKCASAGCHADFQSAAGLDLASADVGGRLTDADGACGPFKLIDSANPANSLLYKKVTDDPGCGSKMPIGGTLTPDEQACILGYIEGL